MVSTYGYITLANLESYTGLDYSAIDATKYSDANVEYKISTAERIINGIVGTVYTGTIPDRIVSATLIISDQLMRIRITQDGYIDPRKPDDPETVKYEGTILKDLLRPEQADYLDEPHTWVKTK